MSSPPLPLSGVRVLDLATVLAGPVTATFLGDFGADVVKVEEPGRGDFTRGGSDGARSPMWAQEARNKRSITLNMREERGRELLRRLVPHFDVVVTNFRPPTLAEWGLEPADLLALNERAVIMCLTGYGLTGPYKDRGAFDRTASAFSGLTYVSGYPDRDPVRTGYAVIDYMGAYLAAFAVVTALYHRDVQGGKGQVIDLALYEAGFRASEDALVRYATEGTTRERLGNRNRHVVPASDFTTQDGRLLTVHAGTDPLFRKLMRVVGRPELSSDPRFATRDARSVHQEELYAILGDWVGSHTAEHASEMLNAAGVPASPIMSIRDIAEDPHYTARESFVTVEDEDHGALPMVAPLPHLSATPGRIRTLGPALGSSNDAVFKDLLGLSQETIDELRRARII